MDKMIKLTNTAYIRIFEQYNTALAEAFERIVQEMPGNDPAYAEALEGNLSTVAHNAVQDWFDEETGGQDHGGCLIDRTENQEDALNMAIYAAAFCDDGIPDRIKIMLNRFQPQIGTTINQYILAGAWNVPEQEEDYLEQQILSVLLQLLGEWQDSSHLEQMIHHFAGLRDPDERIAQAMRQYLVALDKPSLTWTVQELNDLMDSGSRLQGSGEYLLIALADIGKEHRDDVIYACLKRAFQNMASPAIGAICLGDYGDGRAVVFLRGWAMRHLDNQDRQTMSEVFSTIKRLGGQIDDLR
ncbi:MAG: hypothetical protein VB070_08250 [Clostridiaceae bacterium]|nr:hypothetical protein [Clostridiaceae bacterium]